MSAPAPGAPLPPGCQDVDELLVDLALGYLAGEPRADALTHVEGCARCAAEVTSMSSVVDDLLALAPATEPPAGFEARALARLGIAPVAGAAAPRGPRALPWAGVPRAAAAALVVVTLAGGGFLVGAIAGRGGPSRPAPGASGTPLQAAPLLSHGQRVGRVMVYAGNPTWLFMWVDDGAWQGALRCQVVVDNGPVVTLGQFWLSGGRAAWAQSVDQPAGRLKEARIVGPEGAVLAVARLG